jgi:crotonobetainyl-CoA:carnitine CoA-transferase CaiB-like acyl-CoA transferase
MMRLVDVSDVLIENMRPPVKYRLGFDFVVLVVIYPAGRVSKAPEDIPAAA